MFQNPHVGSVRIYKTTGQKKRWALRPCASQLTIRLAVRAFLAYSPPSGDASQAFRQSHVLQTSLTDTRLAECTSSSYWDSHNISKGGELECSVLLTPSQARCAGTTRSHISSLQIRWKEDRCEMFKRIRSSYHSSREWSKRCPEAMVKSQSSVLSLNSGEQHSSGEFEKVHRTLKYR